MDLCAHHHHHHWFLCFIAETSEIHHPISIISLQSGMSSALRNTCFKGKLVITLIWSIHRFGQRPPPPKFITLEFSLERQFLQITYHKVCGRYVQKILESGNNELWIICCVCSTR